MTHFQFCILLSSIFIAICNKDDKRLLGTLSFIWCVIGIIAEICGK